MKFSASDKISFPLVLITFNAAVTCLIPYLGPQMRDKGFSIKETATINMTSAFISIIGILVAGPLADRRGKYKLLITMASIMSAVFYTTLLFVPKVVRVPRNPLKQFDCISSIYLEKCGNWEDCSDAQLGNNEMTNFRISKCRYWCENSRVADVGYPLHVCFESGDGNLCSVYNPLLRGNVSLNFQTFFSEWKPTDFIDMKTTDFLEYEEGMPPNKIEVCQFKPRAPIVVDKKTYNNIYCRPVPEYCSMRCHLTFTKDNKEILPSPCTETFGDIFLTFWSFLGMRSMADLCLVVTMFLLDALVVTRTNDFGGFYGRMHLWSAVGLASLSPLSGVLIDYFSAGSEFANYLPAVLIYDFLVVVACPLLIPLRLDGPRRVRSIDTIGYQKQSRKPCTIEIILLLVVILLLGIEWGIMETYLHWYYVDIGCSNLLLGLTQCVAFCCSLPFLLISKNMVQNIGRANIIVFAFLFYAIRYAGVSFVHNPWWILPFEAMETFTLSVMWIGVVAYGQSIVSSSSRLAMQYSLNIAHYCAGRGIGSYLGGLFFKKFTRLHTFRGIALFSTLIGFTYLLLYHAYLKREYKPNAISNAIKKLPWSSRKITENGDAKIRQPILYNESELL